MPVGTLQNIIVCVPKSAQRGSSIAPCIDDGTVKTQPAMMQAYVVDPGQQTFMNAILEPFDYAYAGSLWTLAFSMVVGLFLVSRKAGVILEFIRHG